MASQLIFHYNANCTQGLLIWAKGTTNLHRIWQTAKLSNINVNDHCRFKIIFLAICDSCTNSPNSLALQMSFKYVTLYPNFVLVWKSHIYTFSRFFPPWLIVCFSPTLRASHYKGNEPFRHMWRNSNFLEIAITLYRFLLFQ